MQQPSLPQIQSLSQAPLATQYSSLLFTQQLSSAQQPSFFPQPPSLSYFEIVFSVLTGFSVNLSANWQAVEIIWE
jgi:hypothetical protein